MIYGTVLKYVLICSHCIMITQLRAVCSMQWSCRYSQHTSENSSSTSKNHCFISRCFPKNVIFLFNSIREMEEGPHRVSSISWLEKTCRWTGLMSWWNPFLMQLSCSLTQPAVTDTAVNTISPYTMKTVHIILNICMRHRNNAPVIRYSTLLFLYRHGTIT